jgi:hypothetical protein
MAEHVVVSNNKVTKEFVKEVSNKDVPLSFLRRKLGKYKVRKALEDLDVVAAQLSDGLRNDFDSALGEIGTAFRQLDSDVKDSFLSLVQDFRVFELKKLRREGKLVDHVRLNDSVEIVPSGDSTVFKVKKKQ